MTRAPSSRGGRPRSTGVLARRTIDMRGGRLRLVVVADTHGRPHPESRARIAAEKPDGIVHAGDIGDLAVLSELEEIAPVFAVRGNIDGRGSGIPDTLTLDLVDPTCKPIRLLVVHMALFGPKLQGDVAALARKEGAALVICGHSHVPFIGHDKGVDVFNPGSIGPRRFRLPIVFGVMNIDREIQMRHLDCETGQTWHP